MNSVTILQHLLQCQSLTPNDAGCMEYIESLLKPMGFKCYYFDKNQTRNFYGEVGEGDFNFCFAGHTDVVPVGDEKSWKYPPFFGVINDGKVYGRGTSDMKGGIAAFIASLQLLDEMPKNARISILLTSDEEGPAVDGIQAILPILKERGFMPSLCLVGEPTNASSCMGGFIKVGRRGSFNTKVIIKGKMGHVAYQEDAKNPHIPLIHFLDHLTSHTFDEGTDKFAPTNLEITNINSFNNATNVIPEHVELSFNIRFNTLHNKESLTTYLKSMIDKMGQSFNNYEWSYQFSCDSNADICENPVLINTLKESVHDVLGIEPECTTKGGTSDARFIQYYCPVVEFGLLTDQAHQIDEHVDIESLENLVKIYHNFLQKLLFSDLKF